MSNWSLSINSTFKPYTLQELMPIYAANQQTQINAENELSNLQTQASVWERLANSTIDKKEYEQYKAYANDINNQVQDLLDNGINVNTRRNLLRLRSQYGSTFAPMQEAYNRRQQLSDTLWKLSMQDPTLLVERDPSQMSLSFFKENPAYNPRAYSGKMLTAQAAQQVQNVANRISSLSKLGKLDKYYDEIQKSYGLTPEQVDDFINGKVDNSFLNTIINNTLESSGITKWADSDILQRAREYAYQGIYQGIGKSDIALQRDLDVMTPMEQAQYQGALLDNQLKTAQLLQLQNQDKGEDLPINPSPIYTPEEQDEAAKMYEKYHNYFYTKNGRTYLKEKGREEYYKRITTDEPVKYDEKAGKWYFVRSGIVHSSMQGSTGEKQYVSKGTKIEYDKNNNPIVKVNTGQSHFRSFLDSIGAGKYLNLGKDKKGWQPGNIGNLWVEYIKHGVKGDARRFMEYNFKIDKSDQENFKQTLNKGYNGGDYKIVGIDRKNKKWRDKDSISAEDIASGKYTPTDIQVSLLGITATLQGENGEVLRVRVPESVNWKNMQQIHSAMVSSDKFAEISKNNQKALGVSSAQEAYEAYQKGTLRGKPLTEKQRELIRQIYDAEKNYRQDTQTATWHTSQLNQANTTKPTEYEAHSW